MVSYDHRSQHHNGGWFDTANLVHGFRMTVGERIATVREVRGWKRPELARRMGTTPQQLERLEKGQRRISEEWLNRAAQALEVSPAELLQDGEVSLSPSQNAQPFKYEGPSLLRVPESLPIYGTALGAEKIVDSDAIEQTMLNTGEIVGYLKRPAILNERTDVYGLYVQGHSMEPAFSAGATIVAETKRPPRIGDDVVVYLRPDDHEDDGNRARCVLVKRLIRRSASFVELEQFNPFRTFRVQMDDVVRIDRVMTLGDLLT